MILKDLRVLVAEDRILIAHRVAQILRDAGCFVLGPVPTVRAGLHIIYSEAVGQQIAAVLDIDLRGEESYALAEGLQQRGVPFLFLTGYGRMVIPERWQATPCVEKPFEAIRLLDAVAAVSGRGPSLPASAACQNPPANETIRRAWETIRRSRDLVTERRILNSSGTFGPKL
jgi:DNA-binding LytR/AlgR family response regulator